MTREELELFTDIRDFTTLFYMILRQRSSEWLELCIESDLRMVPTKYKSFCARLGSHGKTRSLQVLMESTIGKIRVATNFFEIISLETQQKC